MTDQNTQRQLPSAITALPASGARMGETLNTSMSSDIMRAAWWPVCKSRTTARGMAMPADAPSPCTKRSATRVWMSCASAQPMLASTNRPRPRYSGSLRPHRSDSVPNTGCPTPSAKKKAVRLACTAGTGAFRLAPICGSAGRYMSMAKGPMAESKPRMSTMRTATGSLGAARRAGPAPAARPGSVVGGDVGDVGSGDEVGVGVGVGFCAGAGAA